MQTAADEAASRCGAVDRLAEQAELVVDRGAVGLNRRRDVLREQLELEPPVAAYDAEAAALAGRSAMAVRQSTWTPIERGVIAKVRLPPPTNVTGTVASAAERRSRSFWAAFGLIPPTSMPAILVPSASRSAEPAKKSGTPTASRPAASAEDRDPGPETGADD